MSPARRQTALLEGSHPGPKPRLARVAPEPALSHAEVLSLLHLMRQECHSREAILRESSGTGSRTALSRGLLLDKAEALSRAITALSTDSRTGGNDAS